MPEEEERFTIRGLLKKHGYIIRIPGPWPQERTRETDRRIEEAEELRKKLDVLVMRMARELREKYGDVMFLSDFVTAVSNKFEEETGKTVSIDDVLTSIEELARKGLIAGLMTLSSGARIIRIPPEGFGEDERRVLDIVSRREPPEITLEELASEVGWSPARARAALKALEGARVARYVPGSLTGGQDRWHFPGLEKKV